MNKQLEFIKKYSSHKASKYIFFGILSTLVNFGFFALFHDVFRWQILLANALSVTLAILFAYYVNARFVFQSQVRGFMPIIKELGTFVSARLITMVIEIFGVGIVTDWLLIDAKVSKLLINIIVLILNYIFSAIIFRKTQ